VRGGRRASRHGGGCHQGAPRCMLATGGGAAAGRTGYEAAGRRHKDPRWEWLGMGASVGGAWCLSGRRARPAVVVGEDGK